jgi:DNA-directed RNA polymerase subunit L
MSIKIKNIKIDELTYDKKHFAEFDKCVEYVKLIKPDYKKYLPSKPQHKVQFEILDTVSDFANCIRRFLLDEIIVYSMNVHENNITTNDKFILSDHLKKRIELIPFQQKLPNIDDLKISLIAENKTDDIMTVYTRHINVTDKKNKPLDSEKYFSTNIPLTQLRSNTSLEITDINIVNGCAKEDAGKFCLLANLSYEIADVNPFEESKYEKKGESSLNSTPTYFKISYATHRNIEPKKIMILCCDGITERLSKIQEELSCIKINTLVYFSDLVNLETKGDVKLYHFKGEYWTIANIISRYCFLEFKEIKFVCACITHPSTEESIVKIIHPESNKILISAINHILADINIVKKAFL